MIPKLNLNETVENVLFLRREIAPNTTLKDMKPFIVVIEQQNDMDASNKKHFDRIQDILEESTNWN